ncbi:MAG TPA: allophanate hydrolase subunit 1 [Methylocella sp.]|nr:allophanate hydrolase subunit 1 [Methylocella sp.]
MTNLPAPRYLPAGESALVVEFGDTIDPKIHDRLLALDAALQQAKWEGVTETVPTYRSLMIHFDPRRLTTEALVDALAGLDYAPAPPRTRRQFWHIPACYDAPHGEDIAEVVACLDLPRERVIGLHHGARYRVYMYGFAPGFTFLGGLPEELTIPRRAVPRPPAPPGSLLIAGGQALIAGCAMPTGWYGIGRTPVKMFDPRRERAFLADIGDELCFEQIDPAAFDAMSSAAEAGEFCARHEYLDES